MAPSASGSALRRGLPRVPGGEPWPPAGAAPVAAETVAPAASPSDSESRAAASVVDGGHLATPTSAVAAPSPVAAPSAAAAPSAVVLRRGLPRVAGGEPWPPASVAADTSAAAAAATTSASAVTVDAAPAVPATRATAGSDSGAPGAASVPDAGQVASPSPAAAAVTGQDAGGETLRRGLPRTPGGEPWPPAGTVSALASTPTPASSGASSLHGLQETVAPVQESGAEAAPVAQAPVAQAPAGTVAPLTTPQTVWPGRAATHRPVPAPEPVRIGPFTKGQWAGAVVVGGLGLLVAAGMAVALVRFFLSLDFMRDFLATYPGEYHLPEGAPVGIPAWLGWQHFFNVFLMVLIIRTGLTIRHEKRPTVFWAPKKDPKGKTSLTIWFHQSLDLLWIVNGVVFVVLLFVTGQWMRIVPTSWEVFPNAVSAALQYVSLDWPTENGWVNYNSLQQLAYFATVFLAAPLAVVTGFRMSGLWPKSNPKLNAAYPIEWARKVHFPTMLYFVVFIAIHVFLVLATGALRNLNHMYAAQGSVDGVAYADNWTGFWLFVASLVVIAGAWVAARPLVLAPIARMFGTVSGR